MTAPNRSQVLDANKRIRDGVASKPTRLDDGEVAFRIPESDWPIIMQAFPDLQHPDHVIRLKAWHEFRRTEFAKPYLVTRTPDQVRRGNKNRIIVK